MKKDIEEIEDFQKKTDTTGCAAIIDEDQYDAKGL